MSYKNIGTPSGNNLYITIPLRGTQNWDEKLESGFFVKVSEHDHTPGKGAAIVEAALEAPVQTKLAQIATNTSNISSIDSRVSTLEESSLILISSQTDADNLDSTIENSIIDIEAAVTITGKTLSNCKINVAEHTIFSNCIINGADVGSDVSSNKNVTFQDGSLNKTEILGMNNITFEKTSSSSNTTLNLNQISIPTSYSTVFITNNHVSSAINLNDSRLFPYSLTIAGKVITQFSSIETISMLSLNGNSDNDVQIKNQSIIKARLLKTNSNLAVVQSSCTVFSYSDSGSYEVNITDGSSTLTSGANRAPFKIIEGVLSDLDEVGASSSSSNLQVMVAADVSVPPNQGDANTDPRDLFLYSADYDPSATINTGTAAFDPPSSGSYIFNITAIPYTSSTNHSIKIYKNQSLILNCWGTSGTINTGDMLVSLTTSDYVVVEITTDYNSVASMPVNYTIKKIV